MNENYVVHIGYRHARSWQEQYGTGRHSCNWRSDQNLLQSLSQAPFVLEGDSTGVFERGDMVDSETPDVTILS